MSRAATIIVAFIAVALFASPLCAAQPAGPPTGAQDVPKGPWPPKRLIEAGLRRMIRDLTKHHKLDAKQSAVLEREVMSRWPAFLKEHRPVLQKLINEYLEVAIVGKAPSAEKVAGWAKAFQPVVEAAAKEADGSYKAIRKVLRPDQIKTWDKEYKSFGAEKDFVQTEVAKLARGHFNPRTWRSPLPSVPVKERLPVLPSPSAASGRDHGEGGALEGGTRSGGSSNRFKPGRGAKGPPRYGEKDPTGSGRPVETRRPSRSLDAWESHVRQFISRHRFSTGQANSAMAILKEVRSQAKTYESRHQKELKRLERAVSVAEPAARPRLKEQLHELRRPIDDLFDELHRRLDGLLSEEQRRGTRK